MSHASTFRALVAGRRKRRPKRPRARASWPLPPGWVSAFWGFRRVHATRTAPHSRAALPVVETCPTCGRLCSSGELPSVGADAGAHHDAALPRRAAGVLPAANQPQRPLALRKAKGRRLRRPWPRHPGRVPCQMLRVVPIIQVSSVRQSLPRIGCCVGDRPIPITGWGREYYGCA